MKLSGIAYWPAAEVSPWLILYHALRAIYLDCDVRLCGTSDPSRVQGEGILPMFAHLVDALDTEAAAR